MILSGSLYAKGEYTTPKIKGQETNDYLPTWCFKADLHFPQVVWRLNYVQAGCL